MTVATALPATTFRAMGVTVELQLDAPDAADAFVAAAALIERLEGILSRFREDSALSRLNRLGRVDGEPELAEVAALAHAARARTGGRFDPTVHDALIAWGYDRTFDEIEPLGAPSARARCGGAFAVAVVTGTVELAPGVRLDLGGIAKGWVVDRTADLLGEIGPCLVNAGGDLSVRGAHEGGPWPVAVELPDGALTLALPWGSLATSGCDVRRWACGDAGAHHLIDPATGAPSTTDLLRVTVTGPTTVDAEVDAKRLFFAGADAARAAADDEGLPAVLVTRAGETILAGGLT